MKCKDIVGTVTESLLGLLKKKPLSEITVSDITEDAGISRMTFYRRFSSKEDVLSSCVEYIGRKIHDICGSFFSCGDKKTYFCALFEGLSAYSDEILAIYNAGLSGIVLKWLNSFMEATFAPETKQSKYRLYQITGAFYNMFIGWLLSDREESCESMAELLCDMVV
ncbi:MAG: TetR/AcrR family transcriptional regulator [Firmicutes bacterium]|nr:TetR/AcrR family transcriptional regulator [Bacillota bacterium]